MTVTDFLSADFPPAVAPGPDEDLSGPARFFNRELSWLQFNWRVLEEAENPKVPLLERVRFVSISATNLDEFFCVRVAGLRELHNAGSTTPAADGLTPGQQLEKIDAETRKLMAHQQTVIADLKGLMADEGIVLLDRHGLNEADRTHLRETFLARIFPILSPLAIDPAHPFPFIPSEGFSLALQLNRREDRKTLRALLPIPSQIERFLRLPAEGGDVRFIPLEEVLLLNIDVLYPRYEISDYCTFRVLRDSDLEVEDEAEDLVREFEVALKRRRRGEVVRLNISAGAPKALKKIIMEELPVEEHETIETDGIIGVGDISELIVKDKPDLLWPSYTPRVPERVQDHEGDMFAAIRQKDMLLHHPYETFDMVVRFLNQAANDPDVVAIKQTLYRTSSDSPIVGALCEAAEAGKSVTALVELKARFDEAANIKQSRKLERAGVHVVYGFLNLKTHCKLSTVVRREGNGITTYSHVGTGNYHHITARIYTDLSFFTCDPALGQDVAKLFNYLSGYAMPDDLKNLTYSPFTLKQELIDRIAEEGRNAEAGKPAAIWGKMNSLIETDVIDALYEAGQKGAQVSLVVRGICGIRPGIKGFSENIRVKSVVGRFLEHSRIVCFANGHEMPSDHTRVMISSADWMGRNLNRRVEAMVECTNPTVKAQIARQIMAANMADTAQSWYLKPDGSYERPGPDEADRPFNCHRFFMENPSLSGRGSAGAGDVPELTHED